MGVNCSRAAATTSAVIVVNETSKFHCGNNRSRASSYSSVSCSTAACSSTACSTTASSSHTTPINNDDFSLLNVPKTYPASPYSSCHSPAYRWGKKQLSLNDVVATSTAPTTPTTTKTSTTTSSNKHENSISLESQMNQVKETLNDDLNKKYHHKSKAYSSSLLLPGDKKVDDELSLKRTNCILIGNDDRNDQLFKKSQVVDDEVDCKLDEKANSSDKTFSSAILKGITKHLRENGYKQVPVVGAAGSPSSIDNHRKNHGEATFLKSSGRKSASGKIEVSCDTFDTAAAVKERKKSSRFQLVWQIQSYTEWDHCSSLRNDVESGCLIVVADISATSDAVNNEGALMSLLPNYITKKLSKGNERHGNTHPKVNALASGEWCEIMNRTFETETDNVIAMLSLKLRLILDDDNGNNDTNHLAPFCGEKTSLRVSDKNKEDLLLTSINNYKIMIDRERSEFDLIKDEKESLSSHRKPFASTAKMSHTDSNNVILNQENYISSPSAELFQVKNERKENMQFYRVKKACNILKNQCQRLGLRNSRLLEENNELEHQVKMLESKLSEDRANKEQMVKEQRELQQQLLQKELQQEWEENLLLKSQQKLQKERVMIEIQDKSNEYQKDLLFQSKQKLRKQTSTIELQTKYKGNNETLKQPKNKEKLFPQLKGGIIQDNVPIISTFQEGKNEMKERTKKEHREQAKEVDCFSRVNCCCKYLSNDNNNDGNNRSLRHVQQQNEKLEYEISNLRAELKNAQRQLSSPKIKSEGLSPSKNLCASKNLNENELDHSDEIAFNLGYNYLNLGNSIQQQSKESESHSATSKRKDNSNSSNEDRLEQRNQYSQTCTSKMKQKQQPISRPCLLSSRIRGKSDSFIEKLKNRRIRKEAAERRLRNLLRSSSMTKYSALLQMDGKCQAEESSKEQQIQSMDKELRETKKNLAEYKAQNDIKIQNEAAKMKLKRQFSTGDFSSSSLSSYSVPSIVNTSTNTSKVTKSKIMDFSFVVGGKSVTSEVSSINGDSLDFKNISDRGEYHIHRSAPTKRRNNSFHNNQNYLREKPNVSKEQEFTTDFEDLKNITLSFLKAKTYNEKKQLFPIVSAVLRLTNEESQAVISSIIELSRPSSQNNFPSAQDIGREKTSKEEMGKLLFRSDSISSCLLKSPPPTIDTTMSEKRLSTSCYSSIISRTSSNSSSRRSGDSSVNCSIYFNGDNRVGERDPVI